MQTRVARDHVPYDVWAAEGALMTTEGNVIHYAEIEAFIEKMGEKVSKIIEETRKAREAMKVAA